MTHTCIMPDQNISSNNKGKVMRQLLACFVLCALTSQAFAWEKDQAGFETLFNGKDLTGWSGHADLWSVKGGHLVGSTEGREIENNTFLILDNMEPADFEFVAEIKVAGNNSGIQYRSEYVDPKDFSLKGYQLDIHEKPEYLGMLYCEKWRGIAATRGKFGETDADGKLVVSKSMPIEPKFDPAEWIEVRVVCAGNHLLHQVNGVTTVDFIDHHPETKMKGLIGLQLHKGHSMVVECRSAKLKVMDLETAQARLKELQSSEGGADDQSDDVKPKKKRKEQPEATAKAEPVADAKPSGQDIVDKDELSALKDFSVEKIYEVPKESQGSWVAMTVLPNGDLIVSDQGNEGLYQVKLPQNGTELSVTKIPADISGAQGLCWHDGSLYVNVNFTGPGLSRVWDGDNDGMLDQVEKLEGATGGGEHGVHAIITDETGKNLLILAGNASEAPDLSRRRPQNWQEDELFPRMWDPRGHARGRMAPGGFVTRFDPVKKTHEMITMGYRNPYDIGLNSVGDLFTYDADMEWDMGMPWYRPTRICHGVSGSDFGWRAGNAKWPEYYEDSLPPVVNIGPGSPTGVVSGDGLKFPAKYQQAIYALDWTFGTIYAILLKPDGSSYTADFELFINGRPLPVTDAVVGKDGNMYFTVGGRGTQSALYRVTYTGKESTQPAPLVLTGKHKKQHDQRLSLEQFHGVVDPTAVDQSWPFLKSDDRFLRYAARVAIESQPTKTWASRAISEQDPQSRVTALVALARMGEPESLPQMTAALLATPVESLNVTQSLALLRAYELTMIRLGRLSESRKEAIAQIKSVKKQHGSDPRVKFESIKLLVALNADGVVEEAWAEMKAGAGSEVPNWAVKIENNARYGSTIREMMSKLPDLHGLRYANILKNARSGWTLQTRREFLEFLNAQGQKSGGASYPGFLGVIRDDFLGTCSNDERAALADLSGESLQPKPDFEITPPQGPGRSWTVGEGMAELDTKSLKQASFENGRNLYFATSCGKCHRFSGIGGDIGPDLTTISNKFDQRYLLESIIEPSKAISDQYASEVIGLSSGKVITGLALERGGKVHIYPIDVNAPEVVVNPDEIEFKELSATSQMPEKLIDTLNPLELRDLIAYLMSGGDEKSKVYSK